MFEDSTDRETEEIVVRSFLLLVSSSLVLVDSKHDLFLCVG